MRYAVLFLSLLLFAGCEKFDVNNSKNDSDVVKLTFQTVFRDTTRGSVSGAFTKLNVMLFNTDGTKVWDRVKSQSVADADFGTMSVKLAAGTYTVVAVGHSSKVAATIKSPDVVQFTASDGEKLTDTFCHYGQITIDDEHREHTLNMYRAVAMVQFVLTDSEVPQSFSHMVIEYSGGSANFNPITLQGITKSSQSERRIRNELMVHQVFTFPYMSESGTLKMTVTAYDGEGTAIRQRTFESVPVTRNRITTYTGHFFEDGDGSFSQTDFGFVVHTDWDGETNIEF